MRKWHYGSTVLVGFALSAVILAGCSVGGGGSSANKQLCVGTDFPISGTDGSEGVPAQDGANLAFSQAKLHGGYTLKVKNFDDAVNGVHNPSQGATNMTNMVSDSCIIAEDGPFNSGVAGAMIPIAANAGLVMISPANTNPGLTKQQYSQQYGFDFAQLHPSGKPNVYFRIPTTDDVQGAVDAAAVLQLGVKKVYIVDDAEPYGKGLADFFQQAFTAGGGTVLDPTNRDEINDKTNTIQLDALVTKMKATNPDGVFYGGVTSNSGPQLRKAMSSGGMATVPMGGGDGICQDPSFVSLAGASAAEGTLCTVAAPDIQSLAGTNASVAKFVTDFKAKFNADPIAYSINAFDAANIEVAAINKVIDAGQTPTRANVLAQVAKTDYTGLTGHITFDANGDNASAKVLSIYQVKSGNWVFVKQVNG